MSAQPISSSKRLILVYGPDAQLRQIAAIIRAANPDANVNLRSTDNGAHMADGDECDRRIIVDSPNGQSWAAAYEKAGLPIERAKFIGGKVVGMEEQESAPFELAKDPPKPITLWDGRVVDIDEAYDRTCKVFNVNLSILTAWSEEQREEAINSVYEVTVPKPEPKVAQKKKKGK